VIVLVLDVRNAPVRIAVGFFQLEKIANAKIA